MAKHEFRVVQGAPAPKNIAPYISIILSDAGAGVNSIYRGDDARALLNAHGHKSQAQLSDDWQHRRPGALPANPPGFSTHELKSDGSLGIWQAYHVPRGGDLPWWGQGFDVNDSQVAAVKRAAAKHNWQVWQPYPTGSEFHHLNFRVEPKPHSLKDNLRIKRLRLTLPRR